jgi:CheY-like chemotaxis protein
VTGGSRSVSWPASPKILLVEAEPDHASAITRALEAAGYRVEHARTSEEAFRLLEHETYGLVLAHYGLPDRSGVELLKEAGRSGILRRAAALLFTGKDDLDSEGFTLLKKPLDLSALLRQVQSLLGSHVGPGPERRASPRPVHKVELALYVNPPWPSSLKARANLDRVMSRAPAHAVHVTVYDVGKDPEKAVEHRVIFSPTLVKIWPEPRMWILGDLSDPRALVDLLESCDIELRQQA